jgi:hypothetical protein
MKTEQLHDLCEAALECALNRELRDEWLEYLEQTRRHEQIVTKLLEELGLDEEEPAGRKVVRALGESLLGALGEVEDVEEDRHLYHTQGWRRPLWMQNLGLDAVLPPQTASEQSEKRSRAKAR